MGNDVVNTPANAHNIPTNIPEQQQKISKQKEITGALTQEKHYISETEQKLGKI